MKIFTNVMKVLAALAAVAGAIYIVATYGEKIVAWAKNTWAKMPCPTCEEDVVAEEAEVPAEEPAAEEAAEEPVAAEAVEEPEVVVAAEEPVAEEADFAE